MRPILILLGSFLTVLSCGGQSSDTSRSSAGGTSGVARTVTDVSAGFNLSCALVDGGVQCWGSNSDGCLGNDSTTYSSIIPVQVHGLTSGVAAIAGRAGRTCALVNGGVQCWGGNPNGELGNNSTTNSPTPVQVQGLTSDVTAISAGDWHTCAVVNDGAQCWGDNNYYHALGSTLLGISPVPIQVDSLSSGTGVTGIAAGTGHTCAVVNGGVQCWGSNTANALGNNSSEDSPVPVQVVGLTSGVTAIAGGAGHNCAVVNGGVQCWGYNNCGQLGNNSSTVTSAVPVQVQGLTSGVTAVTAGECHTCAVVNGGAQCWGTNLNGQLGNNSTTGSAVPVQVQGLTSGVTAIAAEVHHTCAVVNGGVQCWGLNQMGELGNRSTVDSLVPVQVRFP